MAKDHKTITDPELHEPKGVATADINHVYHADGAGSGEWLHPTSHGSFYYSNIGTGVTYTAPVAYTLINPTTTGIHLHEFTHNLTGRLTYTGTVNRHVFILAEMSIKHSTGTGQDCFFAVFKNGVEITGSNVVQTADSANYNHVSLAFDDIASTNDYYEIYLKVSAGNIIVHKYYLRILGVPD